MNRPFKEIIWGNFPDMKFILATKNKHKCEELRRILEPMGLIVLSENDLPEPLPEVAETGDTFEENALLKAVSACRATGLPAIADDSGLCVDYLDGAPGVYSSRFAGKDGDNEANNAKLLKLLHGVEKEKRTARFVSVVACVFPDGRQFTVRGECEGYIATEPQGTEGFGYDPLFISEKGCFGLLDGKSKDEISHRGKALAVFAETLKKYI